MEDSNVFGSPKKISSFGGECFIEEGHILFHGSDVTVKNPRIIVSRKKKDFGPGFYVTSISTQAEKWARRNLLFNKNAVVSKFRYCKSINQNFNIKIFKEVNDEWVDFIANCRSGISHDYDIVEGPMVDDKVFNFAQMYLRGELSKDIFVSYCKFNYPTHQICFCSERALKCLEFLESYEVR